MNPTQKYLKDISAIFDNAQIIAKAVRFDKLLTVKYFVADGYYAKTKVFDHIKAMDKDLIKKLRPDANLRHLYKGCLLYTSPSPRDRTRSRMPSSA